MNLAMMGINFKTASLDMRERLSFSSEQVSGAIKKIISACPDLEIAVLSTCNRTELYAAGPNAADQYGGILRAFLESNDLEDSEENRSPFYSHVNLDAARHLMAVAASLDSMVVGETEILGQVKQAYLLANEAQPDCKFLHPLFHKVFRTAKRVHTETDICRGRVSVSSIAVDFVKKIFHNLSSKCVMVVGAGETSELTLKALLASGVSSTLVLNRSPERGKTLADKYGGEAVQFERLQEHLPRADIVISSTSAPHFVITPEIVRKAIKERHANPVLFIDIAIPRDIDPAVNELENIYVYSIDDLQKVAEENLEKRSEAVENAWTIVKHEAATYSAAFGALGTNAILRYIEENIQQVKEAEMNKVLEDDVIAALPEEAREKIRKALHSTANKLLAKPRNAIQKAGKNGRWDEYSSVVCDLFDVKKDEK